VGQMLVVKRYRHRDIQSYCQVPRHTWWLRNLRKERNLLLAPSHSSRLLIQVNWDYFIRENKIITTGLSFSPQSKIKHLSGGHTPERGKSHVVFSRVDVDSLGLVAFMMFARTPVLVAYLTVKGVQLLNPIFPCGILIFIVQSPAI